MPPASSHSRGGGLPCRGSTVTVLVTNAANGKCSISASPKARRAAIASNVPDALTTGAPARCRRSRHQCPLPGISAVSSARRRAPARRRTGAGSRRGSARRSRSRRRSRTPCRTPARAAQARRAPAQSARTASSIARRAAGVDLRVGSSGELGASRSVTRPWWPAEPSSVATCAPANSSAPSACGRVAEAEQHGHARRQRVARIASGAMPTPPPAEHGAPVLAAGRSRGRAGRAATARRPHAARTGGACPGRRPRAGTRSSPSAWRAGTENARGRNGRSCSPPPQRSAAASM